MSAADLRWVRWRARLGFPLAVVCLYFARPLPGSILAGGAIALMGVAIRAAAAGHLQKGEKVAMAGPYARTRNPLYFGSAILALGFVIAVRSWVAAVLVAAYYLALYPFLMRREAAELSARFGGSFDEYAGRVPMFWPRLRTNSPAGGWQFSWARYVRNREYQTALGLVLLLVGFWALYLLRR